MQTTWVNLGLKWLYLAILMLQVRMSLSESGSDDAADLMSLSPVRARARQPAQRREVLVLPLARVSRSTLSDPVQAQAAR